MMGLILENVFDNVVYFFANKTLKSIIMFNNLFLLWLLINQEM